MRGFKTRRSKGTLKKRRFQLTQSVSVLFSLSCRLSRHGAGAWNTSERGRARLSSSQIALEHDNKNPDRYQSNPTRFKPTLSRSLAHTNVAQCRKTSTSRKIDGWDRRTQRRLARTREISKKKKTINELETLSVLNVGEGKKEASCFVFLKKKAFTNHQFEGRL